MRLSLHLLLRSALLSGLIILTVGNLSAKESEKQKRKEALKAPVTQTINGLQVGERVKYSGGSRGGDVRNTILEEELANKTAMHDSLARLLVKQDSIPLLRRLIVNDTLTALPDSLFITQSDSLLGLSMSDSLFTRFMSDTSMLDWRNLHFYTTEADRKILSERAELASRFTEDGRRRRFRITQDTIRPGLVTFYSLVAPGFGQIYNRQNWKLPILYGGVGGFLAGGLIMNNKLRERRAAYQRTVDLRLPPDVQSRAKASMQRASSSTTICYAMAGATYLYFVADAVFKYRGPVDPVRKATTLAAIFPGMGFVYTKTYWRLPVYYGGFITLATVIDYNNRNYQRFKTAYDLLTDGNPATVDEFNGRFSPEQISRIRSSYRRDRDLAIIGMAAAYLLSIIDTYVIATLKNWDVSDDLGVTVEPAVIDTRFNAKQTSSAPPAYGLALRWKF